MLRETSSINRSLFLLGKVIAALGARQASPAKSHVPYRDSLLTKLLMDSLGGTGRTVMIGTATTISLYVSVPEAQQPSSVRVAVVEARQGDLLDVIVRGEDQTDPGGRSLPGSRARCC